MIDMKKYIAIIPARKGSKRFPGKNRSKINGKSLVELAILCALESQIFDQIILSTDDDYFFDLNKKYAKCVIRQRPASLAQDTSTAFDVLMDICEAYNYEQSVRFCYLQPTSPLRLKSDLINSISDNSVSVYYDEENRLNNGHKVIDVLAPSNQSNLKKLGEDGLQNWYFNGLFYWIDLEILKAQGSLLGNYTKFIETPMERSYDIDYEEEFIAAKLKFVDICI